MSSNNLPPTNSRWNRDGVVHRPNERRVKSQRNYPSLPPVLSPIKSQEKTKKDFTLVQEEFPDFQSSVKKTTIGTTLKYSSIIEINAEPDKKPNEDEQVENECIVIVDNRANEDKIIREEFNKRAQYLMSKMCDRWEKYKLDYDDIHGPGAYVDVYGVYEEPDIDVMSDDEDDEEDF